MGIYFALISKYLFCLWKYYFYLFFEILGLFLSFIFWVIMVWFRLLFINKEQAVGLRFGSDIRFVSYLKFTKRVFYLQNNNLSYKIKYLVTSNYFMPKIHAFKCKAKCFGLWELFTFIPVITRKYSINVSKQELNSKKPIINEICNLHFRFIKQKLIGSVPLTQ